MYDILPCAPILRINSTLQKQKNPRKISTAICHLRSPPPCISESMCTLHLHRLLSDRSKNVQMQEKVRIIPSFLQPAWGIATFSKYAHPDGLLHVLVGAWPRFERPSPPKKTWKSGTLQENAGDAGLCRVSSHTAGFRPQGLSGLCFVSYRI